MRCNYSNESRSGDRQARCGRRRFTRDGFMKGVVFNLLEEVLRRSRGEDTWAALLDQAGLAGSYTSLGSYPDDDRSQLVLVASRALAMAPADVLRWFRRPAMPTRVRTYP